MRFDPVSDDVDDGRALVAAELVTGVDSGHPSPWGLPHRARRRVADLRVVSAVRLGIGDEFPMPSAVSGVAGGSSPARTTSPPVDLSWPEPLTRGASLWMFLINKNKIN